MNELNETLTEIMNTYNKNISNDEKHRILSHLWTNYYTKSRELEIQLDLAYQLYLLGENESYIINEPPHLKGVSNISFQNSFSHLCKVLESKNPDGISLEESEILIDFIIYKARMYLSSLGIDLLNHSLNGFCELCQALTLMPFEKMGLFVTKNKAKGTFGYPKNHSFGTVTFPILENKNIYLQPFLIDITYRQFFTTNRCNEGRYYAKDENTGLDATPDPGYFMLDKDFARKLMRDGYIILNKESAEKYGRPFYLSSLSLNQKESTMVDYYQNIFLHTSDYSISFNEILEYGFDIDFSSKKR